MTSAYSSRTLSVFASSSAVGCGARGRGAATCCPCSRSGRRPARASRSPPRPSRRRGALHRVRRARVDEIAEGALDGVERTEAARPSAQQRHQVGRDRLPEREALGELRRIEDGLDVVAVDSGRYGSSRPNRRRGRRRAGPCACACSRRASRRGAPRPVERLQQRRQQETDGSRAEDVHPARRRCTPMGPGSGLPSIRLLASCSTAGPRRMPNATSGRTPGAAVWDDPVMAEALARFRHIRPAAVAHCRSAPTSRSKKEARAGGAA